ncbi:unnamed protein product [Urochloa decumbens]|uniref:Aminotransferase-like plant mobile domain-containing protein n=1 Tax=Urochloa decumbens TaxID=240449 RepID=A0ABC8Y1A0_9POAL
MPASGHRLHDPKPPDFLPLPLSPRTPTPPPPPPSSPPHAVPPLSFRYLNPCPRWSAWVAAALRDPVFAPTLASSAISDSVAASTAAIAPDRAALSTLLSFWDLGTQAFRLPAGPATFTLEDALVLAGLPPAGASLDRALTPEEEDLRVRLVVEREKIRELHPCARAARRVSVEVWLEWFDGGGIRPGEDDELRRLGFLAYWLAFFVTPRLRPRGGELPELAFALAARLSLGERISLAPAMVGNLYADMDRVVTSAVADGVSGRVDVWAPLWLLQVWMWERYKRLRPLHLRAPQFPVSNVRVLHWSRRKRTSTPEEALLILQDEACFEWRPYRYNSLNWMEPKWFNVDTVLVCCRGKAKPEWLLDYIAVISQTVLMKFDGDDMDNSVLYNPHLVARQFGYDQAAPVSVVSEFDFEEIEMWVPGIGRYGMPSEDYVAWCSSGQFNRHQVDDQYSCSVVRGHENGASSLQRNVNKKYAVVPALDQFTQVTRREQLGQMDNGSHENETKVIVLGLSVCDKGSRTTSAKRKKEKKERRYKFAEDGGSNKKKSKVRSNMRKGPLQFEVQKYTVLQEDLNSDSNRCDELVQLDSDDECIVLEQHENKCEVINLDDDEEQSALDTKDHNMQLVQELEEFVRSGLLSQWEESADEDDLSGRRKENLKKSFSDPYAEAAMREYPLFFELIPQKPHYRGFINNDEALGDLTYSGLWFLLVDLAKEVLKTSCDTHASEITCLMKKAQRLQQLGFNVKHLIARLKEPHIRLRKLQDCRSRLEHAREKEKEASRVESLSSHLSKLKHNIRTMEKHLDEKKQVSSAHDKLNEGLDLVSLEKEVETAEKYCQAMKDEVAAMRLKYSVSGA